MAPTRTIHRAPSDDGEAAAAKLKNQKTIKFHAQGFVTPQVGKLLEEYDIGDLLGTGGYGEVYLGVHKKSGAERAIKVITKAPDAKSNQAVLHEFNVVRKLDHPNLLKMYNLYQDESYFYIVTDIYKGGELFEEIIKRKTFTESDAAELMNNLLSCINYCHKQNLVHRDLKPENILLEESMEMDDLKVIDFGLAESFHDGETLKESVGTIYYMAPEVLEKKYGSKVDIWSCGVICFILLSGYPPFDGETDEDIEEAILNGGFQFKGSVWDAVSDDAADFIQDLLSYEPNNRPTAEQALQHPWLQNSRKRVSSAFKKRATDSTRSYLNNLKNFNATSKLKQATCAFIASQLCLKQEKEEIDEVFRALDTNCDGKLNKDEVKNGYFDFYGKHLEDEELDKMFQQICTAGTGAISYSEFVVAAMFEKNLLDNSRLQAAFCMFDSDGDGMITVDNFKTVLNFFREETDGDDEVDDYILEKVIKQVDSDGDDRISYQDFQEMMFRTVAVNPPPSVAQPAVTGVPAIPKRATLVRRRSVVDVQGAEACMAMFADAVQATAESPKRHRRNSSHLSHFASLDALPPVRKPASDRRISQSMGVLPNVTE